MMWLFGASILILMFLIPQGPLNALPIGYGYNQGKLKFNELKTDDFIVYYDARTPQDGRTALNSLSAAKPHLERWFKVKRNSPLIVNMSAESDNASFANFITDSIELQTLGQGSRDLAWHEYTHAMMYQHLDNIFGPAGAILHLPWMEAWFLEGLAEALSVSVGSEQQAGIEKFQALQNDWPTWDRIHSLYTSGPFSYRGYATSGAFVSWILRTYGADKLAEALQTFRSDTMPWWWPWALFPVNNFWPMDTMLRQWTGHGGQKLYELYKEAATSHWKATDLAPSQTLLSGNNLKLSSPNGIISIEGLPHALEATDDKIRLRSLKVDGTGIISSWGESKIPITDSDRLFGQSVAVFDKGVVYSSDYWPKANRRLAGISLVTGGKTRQLKRKANWIQKVWVGLADIWWIEHELESTRLCKSPIENYGKLKPVCILDAKTPTSLVGLGATDSPTGNRTSTILLASTTQTLRGDRHEIISIDTQSGLQTKLNWQHGGRPHSAAFTPSGLWLLVSDRSVRYLRRYSASGDCLESISPADVPLRLLNSRSERPWVVNWLGSSSAVANPLATIATSQTCTPLSDHSSPLLAAIRHKGAAPLTFQEAVQASSTWAKTPSSHDSDVEKNVLAADKSMDGVADNETPKANSAKWRGRPIFAFPWIGADDALGPQLGIVSVPLMDHMQNETVRATVLLGLYSRFPYQELSLVETRFEPTWTFSVYRAQAYNGRYEDQETKELLSSYLDEKGGRVDLTYAQSGRKTLVLWDAGLRGGHLARYIGDASHYGSFKEIYGGASFTWKFAERWRYQVASQNKVAPKSINESFDYTVTGASTSIVRLIGQGSLELGVDGEKTRGPYRRDLQEMYTPLKTFIPGSGGGYNKNSYALTLDEGLFSPLFGDTQARAKLNFTHPLIEDFDRFVGLIYIDRLDFSAFLNHGTAWRGDKLPSRDRFLTAQGYNVDLLMDNKGVRFNVGLGAGQVIGRHWQAYSTAGFDALF